MAWYVWVIGCLVGLLATGAALLWVVYRQLRAAIKEIGMLEQTLAADDTPRRRPGQPTNLSGGPARVTQGRIKKRR
jgi:hypothetical protein